jgi:citrate lyase subunit beta/citryl-CoA lyase
VLNDELTPSDAEVEHAQGLLAAFEEGLAQGKGAVEYKGKMIDLPVVDRAKELLHKAEVLKQNKN